MPTINVIHARPDRSFVEGTLLPLLPCLGFDCWVCQFLKDGGSVPPKDAIAMSDGIIALISRAGADSAAVREEAALALSSGCTLIPVLIDDTPPDSVAKGLSALATVDARDATRGADAAMNLKLGRHVRNLLPPVEPSNARKKPTSHVAERIDWREDVFSGCLADAVAHHDFNSGSALITAFAHHIAHRTDVYATEAAHRDLGQLRMRRQFVLMSRYAEGALDSGTKDFKVRRHYAQSLIEQGRFSEAFKVLEGVVHDAPEADGESLEARGLIGRALKQQYVNAPKAPDSQELLRRSIDAYRSVYSKHASEFWHGINAASLLLRGSRDGFEWADHNQGKQIAAEIAEAIERKVMKKESVDVWDLATRAEAFVALEQYDAANDALTDYLRHDGMQAFEVSSTHRQFDEVLQLRSNPKGRPLLDRLWHAVERFRGGGLSQGTRRVPMLVRVTDPAWQPGDVPDLTIHSRLGTIVSIQGSEATVRALLKDPAVVDVEESRPGAATMECERSLPFIRVMASYQGNASPFEETGGSALVAFIDDGIDVMHEAFTDATGKSRIVGIWDQRDDTGQPPPDFTYGTHHMSGDIDRYVATRTVPVKLGRNENGHGTHVASIAAGRGVGAFAGGIAHDASIIVVISNTAESIGYSRSHVDALSYINTVAKALDKPVVVNVSQGMNAGAHDGQSSLEIAFDEFSTAGTKPGRVVVKSAGNERDKNAHAELTVGTNATDSLVWTHRDPIWPRERLEFWWSSVNRLRFRLRSPTGDWSAWASQSEPHVSGSLQGGNFAMELTLLHPDNGASLLRVDVSDIAFDVVPGEWEVEILGEEVRDNSPIHVWIERSGGSLPSSFLNHMSEKMTLSIPGTARSVITVGAIKAAEPTAVGSFSSYGPTRDDRRKPEVSAPGIDIKAATGGTANDARLESGTSMAAPHVAGAIALVLSRAARLGRPWPTATQISAVLCQKTINNNGYWTPGAGWGPVDVSAVMKAF
jgi:subtilisin family serine protease